MEVIKVLRTLKNLSKMNRSLLLLCKIEGGQFEKKSTVDFEEVLKSILPDYETVFAHKQITTELTVHRPFCLSMDESLATTLATNLLKNAYVHNVEGGTVSVVMTEKTLRIENTGKKQTRRLMKQERGIDQNGIHFTIMMLRSDRSALRRVTNAERRIRGAGGRRGWDIDDRELRHHGGKLCKIHDHAAANADDQIASLFFRKRCHRGGILFVARAFVDIKLIRNVRIRKALIYGFSRDRPSGFSREDQGAISVLQKLGSALAKYIFSLQISSASDAEGFCSDRHISSPHNFTVLP
jgi:hypothetical protein